MANKVVRGAILFVLLLITTGPRLRADKSDAQTVVPFPRPAIPYAPEGYLCRRTDQPLTIDGLMDEPAWQRAAWTADVVDIQGGRMPPPRLRTRARMLWDDTYFYVAAEMDEPDVWAKLTERDAVIFYDNDFEVFIDPDGDTHEYYELEVNAFNTQWDLFLIKPYRDGGPAIDSWDIQGLLTAVAIDGTLNQPGDRDRGWSIEIALPWAVLEECAHKPTPPENGDHWRVNFSRVEWRTEVRDGEYVKVQDPQTGRPLPEDNWVWSPQGLINMHYPEMWGVVEFSDQPAGGEPRALKPDPADQARWFLRTIYYEQQDHFRRQGRFARTTGALEVVKPDFAGHFWPPLIVASPTLFEVTWSTIDGTKLHITQDGHVW